MKKTIGYILIGISIGIFLTNIYTAVFQKPSNSIGLYHKMLATKELEDIEHLLLNSEALSKEDYEYITALENSPYMISQYTLFSFHEVSYLITTTPGTDKLQIIQVDKVPEDIQSYLVEQMAD
ncbi:MAG: hypothetical protein ACI33P_13710 [Lysinibacillus sp.]